MNHIIPKIDVKFDMRINLEFFFELLNHGINYHKKSNFFFFSIDSTKFEITKNSSETIFFF